MISHLETGAAAAQDYRTAARRQATPKQESEVRSRAQEFIQLILISSFVFNLIASPANCVSVHEVRFIATKSGRTDYALTNETIELSCHYLMKDHLEEVKQLVWSKDGQNFIRWRKGEAGLKVLGYTFKGHIDNSSTNHHLIIHNATIEMHGKYRCSIRTDLGFDENEQNVVIIAQPACRLGDWRIRSDPSQCRETLLLDCRNMFPKPAPSCSLWNGKLEKAIMGLSVVMSEEEPQLASPLAATLPLKRQQTYRVRYVQQFDLLPWPQAQHRNSSSSSSSAASNQSMLMMGENKKPSASKPIISPGYLLQFAGHLWFKCDISVPETSWRLSLVHKMFDYSDACLQDPLEAIARWRLNYGQYAANQMLQQQQQVGGSHLHQLNDQELLGSNLKYELIAASSVAGAKSADEKVEFNCWRKPKLGTLAKLSCMNKFHQSAQVMRFKGASLLRCGEHGWYPVKGSDSYNNRQLNNNSRPRASAARKAHLRERSSGGGNSTMVSNTELASLSLKDSRGERKIPQKNGSTTIVEPVTYIQAIDSNDLNEEEDDNNNNDSKKQQEEVEEHVQISAQTTMAPSMSIAPPTREQDDDDDESLDTTIPTAVEANAASHITPPHRPPPYDPLSSMQPSELAALLPTCVSPKARHHNHNHRQQLQQQQRALPNGGDRLPLHDGRPSQILESSERQKPTTTTESGGFFGFGRDLSSIFNFSSSSSGCEHYYNNQQAATMCCCLIAALFFIIITSNNHNHPTNPTSRSQTQVLR